MASHHYLHHHHHHRHQCATTSAAVCHYCYPPPIPDPYLPHNHHHFYDTPYPNAAVANPVPPPTTHGLHYPAPPTGQQSHHGQETAEAARESPAVSSLLRRIATLESSLRDQSPRRAHSLRHTAARTIQTHFRAFLVRRSRTLRQLKELASIKSALNALKSSVSQSTRLDPIFVSHKASRLFFKLDLIQGVDPMIRDGKKSISRELTRFLDSINGFTEKNTVVSTRLVKKNVVPKKDDRSKRQCQDIGNSKVLLEELANRVDALYDKLPKQGDVVDEIPTIKRILGSSSEAEAKAKKSVTFADLVDEDEDSDNGEDDEVKGNHSRTRNGEEVEGFSFVVAQDDDDDDDDDGEGGIRHAVRRDDGSLVFPTMDPRRKIVK